MTQQAKPDLVSATQLRRTYKLNNADVQAVLDKHKVTPVQSFPYGSGMLRLYQRSEVVPLLEAEIGKRRSKGDTKVPPVPQPPTTLAGAEAKLAALSVQVQNLTADLADRLAAQATQCTQQNKALLTAVQKVESKLDVILTQLGVKAD